MENLFQPKKGVAVETVVKNIQTIVGKLQTLKRKLEESDKLAEKQVQVSSVSQ